MANEFKIKKGLIVTGASGGTVVDIQGSQGQLFSVTDDLSGSIFAVSDISGVPILDVNSSGLVTVDGPFTQTGGSDSNFSGDVNIKSVFDFDTATDLFTITNNQNTGGINFSGNNSRIYFGGNRAIEGAQSGTNLTFAEGYTSSYFQSNLNITGDVALTGSNKYIYLRTGTNSGLWQEDDFSLRFGTNNIEALELDNLQNATFSAQAFSAATSSGDASSTLTTKGYVDSLITGATIYRGAWDPSGGGYGSPDLSGVTQTSGYYYICSAAGTAEPNGTGCEPDSWETGDWVIWNDDIVDCAGTGTGGWQKIDNSSVLSGVGTGQTVALWEGASSVTDSETLGNAPITVSGNNTTFAGTINSGNIVVDNNGVPRLTLTDSGNGGGGGASGKITYSNTAGNAISLGYTDDVTTTSDFIISTDAGSTYGGYLGLDAAAIVDPSSIIIDPKTNVYITKAVGIGVKTPNDLLDIHNPATGAVDAQMNFTTADTGTGTSDGFRVGWNGAVAQMYLFEDADMRFATNNAEKMTITSAGGISFGSTGTAYGTAGQILKSNADASPTWVNASTVIGGPYLPLTGGTLTGQLIVDESVKADAFYSHQGTYTGNTYVNDWQKVYSHNWSTFSFSAFTLKVLAGGNTANNNLNADVHINYKMQNGVYRVYANIVNYGSEALLAENFKINLSVTSAASGSWTIWHKIISNYQTPYYTLVGSGIDGTWYSDTPVASPTGDDDTWNERIILNSMSVDVDNSANVGIGTTAPTSLLEISKQLSAASTIDYPYTISSRDDGNSINQAGGEGVGIKFRIAGNAATTPGDSLVGASIAAIRESASDTDSSTGLGFFVTQNDETLDEVLRIDHDGNVGIGTDSPNQKLEVSTNANPTISIANSDTSFAAGQTIGTLEFSSNNETSLLGAYTPFSKIKAISEINVVGTGSVNGAITFETASANVFGEKMRITSGGNVGIGTGADVYGDLHLEGGQQDIVLTNTNADGVANLTISRIIGQARGYSNNGAAMQSIDFVTNATTWYKGDIVFKTNNTDGTDTSVAATEKMRIASNGNVGIGFTSPDSTPLSTTKLSVNGNTYVAGTLGIGATNPNSKLDVRRSGSGVALELHQTSGSANDYVDLKMIAGNTNAGTLGTILRHKRDGTGGGDFSILTNPTLTGTPTEKLIVKSGGNVGIGTTTPNAKLDVQGTQGQLFSVTDDLSGSIFAVADISGVPIFDVNSSGVSYFDGNVGIGTDNPNQLLHTLGGTVKVESDGGNAAGAVLELKHANNNTTDVCATINFTNNIGGYAAIEGGTTGANNTGYLSFKTDNVGVQSEGIRVLGDGAIKLSQYTLTQQTGTSAYLLGVDASGNVVQSTNIPSGTGGGAGPYLPLSAGSSYPLTDTLYIKPSGSPTNTMLISARANDSYGNIQFTNAAETVNWTQLRSTSTQFTINNANVGINVTSPGVKLQLVSADEQLTNFSSSVADQLAYSQINASSSTSGVITGAAALELVGKANASGHGRHAWIGAEGTSNTTLLTKLKFKIRGETATGYDWAGAAEAPTIMTLEGDGNVGIGTTEPQSKLHIETGSAGTYNPNSNHDDVTIEGSGNIGLQLFSPNTSYQYIAFGDPDSVNVGYLRYYHTSNEMVLRTNGGDHLRIDSSGNVGIGGSTPSYLLDVRDGTSSGAIARFAAINPHVIIESSTAGNSVLHFKPNQTGSKSGQFKVTAGNGYNFKWTNDAAGTGETIYMDLDTSTTGGGDLTVKGDIIAYGAPSDKKYKENIKPIESALDKAMQLQGVTFDWKDSESILDIKEDIGFIAQDVEKVLPELVRDSGKGNLSLRYQGITPILLEAIKELKAEIEELKKQIK